ncbi:MAG: hypothetical protein AAGC55_08215 [Myxococcota bacterium]
MSRDEHTDEPTTDLSEQDHDAPASPGEVAQAESLARLIDSVMAGDALPPAIESEQRALAEMAGMIRASTREIELAAPRRAALIDEVLGAVGRTDSTRDLADRASGRDASAQPSDDRADAAPAPSDADDQTGRGDSPDGTVDLATYRRHRLLRAAPWIMTTVATAAAVLLLVVRPVSSPQPTPTVGDQTTVDMPVAEGRFQPPLEQRSRPADALIGAIPRDRVGLARERTDMIYADRMTGYRSMYLARGQR